MFSNKNSLVSRNAGSVAPSNPFEIDIPNTIISGGVSTYRNKVISSCLSGASRSAKPVICFFSKGSSYGNLLAEAVYGNDMVYCFQSNSKNYNPLSSFPNDKILHILQNIGEKYAQFDFLTIELARAIIEISERSKYNLNTLTILKKATDNFDIIFEALEILKRHNSITSQQYEALKSSLFTGQSSHQEYKIRNLLNRIISQSNGAIADKFSNGISISGVIDKTKIIFFELDFQSQDCYIDLCIEDLIYSLEKPYDAIIIFNDMKISKDKSLHKFIMNNNSNAATMVFSTDNIFSCCDNDEAIYNTIIKNSRRYMLFKHSTSASHDAWSGQFGRHKEEEHSVSGIVEMSTAQRIIRSVVLKQSLPQPSISTHLVDVANLKASDLDELADNQFFFIDNAICQDIIKYNYV